MQSTEPTTEVLERLYVRVRSLTSLKVTERNKRDVERVARERARVAAISLDEWVSKLERQPARNEIEHLVRELTVGETYLFRGPVFVAVRESALPELVARRRAEGTRVLRLASAGCATGEEAYSLAISALEALGEAAPSWHVSVLGLDVNAEFLERAESASYGAWSARDAEPRLLERYFEKDGEQLRVKPEVRARVRFQYANLATDPLPAPAIGATGMDLVVCQNVVYYFEPEARTRVITSLSHMLSPGGYLFFGPADLVTAEIPICHTRPMGECHAYQRVGRFTAAPRRRPSGTGIRVLAEPPAQPVPRPPEPDPVGLPPRFATALSLADDGDLVGALGELEAYLAREKDREQAHTLHGFLLAELGEPELALDAFRRAIYLEPRSILALTGALSTARRLGLTALTRRFEQSLKKIAAESPSASIQGWEGMTVGRLLSLFRDAPEDEA